VKLDRTCNVQNLPGHGFDKDIHRVEPRGLEPLTPCLQSKCATNCAMAPASRSPIPESGPADPRCYVMTRGHTNAGNFTLEERMSGISALNPFGVGASGVRFPAKLRGKLPEAPSI
jgi:hypothetical protein